MEMLIQPVSWRNRKQVLGLCLAENQKGFIESTAQCLKEARRLWLWHPVAISVDGLVVGFAMYGRFPREGKSGRVWLDRLLIGAQYQGQGFGKKALSVLCERLKNQYRCKEIYLSCYPENIGAIAMYQKAGFQFNGEKDLNGEDIMVLPYN